jgi:hypothetical protein
MKTLVIILFGLMVCPLYAQDDILPANIDEAFRVKYPKASDLEWRLEGDLYIMEFYRGGTMYTGVFNNNGDWIETAEVIADTDIPMAVQNYIKSKYPDSAVSYSEKVEAAGNKSFYRVNLEDPNGTFVVKSDLTGGNIQLEKPGEK